MSEWVSVEDRLPESSSELVLCFIKSAPGIFRSCDVSCAKSDDWEYVTHWMSLPSPPEDTNG